MVLGPLDHEPQEEVTQAAVLAVVSQCAGLLALTLRMLRDNCAISYLTSNGWSAE